MSVVTLTVKEAEALDAEIAQLEMKAHQLEKTAEEIANLLRDEKLISPQKYEATKQALAREGGIVAYFKKACELYKQAEGKSGASVSRIGREHAKRAADTTGDPLKEASERFAQRILALSSQ